MKSAIDEISGRGLHILILGSYDQATKDILHRLRMDLNKQFERYSCFTVLLENIEVHQSRAKSHDLFILIETENQYSGTVTIVQESSILDTLTFLDETELKGILSDDAGVIDMKAFRKLKEFEKLMLLAQWADVIYLIKENELTRGGELVEVTYLLTLGNISYLFTQNMEFFVHQGTTISTMLKELIEFRNIRTFSYDTYDNLIQNLIERTSWHISRLNATLSRFLSF